MKVSKLPIDLKYLFENKYIECIQMLIILFILKQRRKGIDFEELLYYFTLLSMTTMTTINSRSSFCIDDNYIQNNYLTYEKTIRDNMIILSNQSFVKIEVEPTQKKKIMYSRITEEGKSLIINLDNSYFKREIEKFNNIIETRKFNSKNQREVLVKNED